MRIFSWVLMRGKDLESLIESERKRIVSEAKYISDDFTYRSRQSVKVLTEANNDLEQKVFELQREIKTVSMYHSELNDKYKKLKESQA